MKKLIKVIVYCFVMMNLVGCYSTQNVTSYNDLQHVIYDARQELSQMGYELSGADTRTDNNVYVEGVSYSTKSGFGTAMNNKYVTFDKYTFSNADGNTLSYTVSYETHRSSDDILYVTNVSVPQCEASNPKDYNQLCGYSSPIKKIQKTTSKTPVKVLDQAATWAVVGVVCVVACAIPLIVLLTL